MFSKILATIAAVSILNFHTAVPRPAPVISSHAFSLDSRYQNSFVNNVFKENILLALAYLRGVTTSAPINWSTVDRPFHFVLDLSPGQVFAFHDSVLSQYKGKKGFTTHAHFNSQDGFLSDGYLVGDGVCHLASLIYWVAKDAGLDAKAPTSHDFAEIQGVPRQFGVAIYYSPNEIEASSLQNLYITNNKEKTIAFVFDFDGSNLKISTEEK